MIFVLGAGAGPGHFAEWQISEEQLFYIKLLPSQLRVQSKPNLNTKPYKTLIDIPNLQRGLNTSSSPVSSIYWFVKCS